MSIDISPETKRLGREEIRNGHFRSVDDLIVPSVQAWREKYRSSSVPTGESGKSLLQFFRESPLAGLEMGFERDQDTSRDVAL